MAQCIIAGMTDYENQSLNDIIEDIECWIEYSENTQNSIIELLSKLKDTKFYHHIPYDYKAMIHEMPRICQTNADDLKRTLEVIQSHTLTKDNVELFWKVGSRANKNGEDNKRYYKLSDDGYWHDYGNPEFKIVEDIYAMFGNYCATLLDVTNAASRLKDYIDIPRTVTTMNYENNSINIGNGNNLKKNNFHIKNKTIDSADTRETATSKILWEIIIPVFVGVIIVLICYCLGIN